MAISRKRKKMKNKTPARVRTRTVTKWRTRTKIVKQKTRRVARRARTVVVAGASSVARRVRRRVGSRIAGMNKKDTARRAYRRTGQAGQ